MKRVLVTGASGFIGRRVVPLLVERGYEVHAVASTRTVPMEGTTWHVCDLLDQKARHELVDRVRGSHLLHLAWYTETGAFWTSPKNLAWSAATLELTRAFLEAGGQRATFAGSCAEYEWSHESCKELSTRLDPATPYGVAKDATRRIIMAYAETTGLEVSWGRIFHLYGPDEDPRRLISSVTRALLEQREARTSHGEQIRDFMHVEDVAGALVALADSKVTGAVNVASGEPVRLRHVVELLGELTGASHLLRIGALAAPASDPPFLVADVERLRGEVGFVPRHDLKSGLALTVSSLRTMTRA